VTTPPDPDAVFSGLVAADAAVTGFQRDMEHYASQAGARAAAAEVTAPELEADIG
jgi:hypothetical protein